MPTAARTSVFISYSHADIAWLRLLDTHLKPLTRNQKVEIWSDQKIRKGARWREQIHKQLAMARVGIFLISADFLASDFIHAEELPPLLKAAEREGATLLTVVVRPCAGAFKDSSLNPLQAMNGPDSPLSGMSETEQEKVMASVYDELRSIFRAAPKPVTQTKITKTTAAAPKRPKRVTVTAADKTAAQEAAAKARAIARRKAIAKKAADAKKSATEKVTVTPKKPVNNSATTRAKKK
jgi:hypothetical protein